MPKPNSSAGSSGTRRLLACSASIVALLFAAGGARAQDTQQAAATASAGVAAAEEIVVTGTRLRLSGMQTPVPVTAVEAAELEAMAPGNLITSVSQLPQFYNNQTPNSSVSWFVRGGYGNLDLRGLGINRTLTLLNGRRMISSSAFGGVDINIFPEAMISSVETVTGGASAAYGTDAVAGVVNFILDTDFTGLDAKLQGGITDRGDSESYEASISYGMRLGDRGHLLVSGEIFDQDGVHDFKGRDWYRSWGTLTGSDNVVRAFPHLVSTTASFDGIIFAPGTPINGLAFDRTGNVSPFVLGSPSQGAIGVPGSRHSIADGGSGEDLAAELQTLYPDVKRNSLFAYADYELADGFTVFAQYVRGQNKTFRYNTPRGGLQGTPTAITIFQDNAFLPDPLRQAMIDNDIASFNLRRFGSIEDIGEMWLKDNNVMNSVTAGFTWTIDSGGLLDGWNVDAYYQYGTNKRTWRQLGLRVDRIFAAVDAVQHPETGEIVCRTTLFSDVFAGCVPLNLFGRGNASAAAIDWVVGSEPGQEISSPIFFADSGYDRGETHSFTTEEAKVNRTRMRQHVADITFSGDILQGWAGPITAAFGASWRRESIRQIVEDVTNPASDHDTFRPVRCNDPSIGLRGVSPPDCANTVGIQYSKVSNIRGTIEVPEAFGEILVPLLAASGPIESANLHGAVRWADYTGSGAVWAYKAGLDVNLAGVVRLRGTYSRDVRAANLSERFDKTGGTAVIIDPRYPGDGNINVTIFSGGNPGVLPEKADTFTAGVVVRPPFIPGLSVSLDWYKVDISNAIGQLGTQAVANQCEAGAEEFCSLVTRDLVTDRIILVGNLFVNVAVAKVEGVDLEATYNRELTLFGGAPESIGARLFASWLIENTQTTGSGTIDRAGQTGIQQSDGIAYALPDFKATGNLTYNWGDLSLFLQGRYIGSGTSENAPLPADAVLEDNHVDSAFYADLSLTYKFRLGGRTEAELFGHVTNLFDEDPPVTPYYSAFLGYAQQFNPSLFDVLGRRYTLGVRIRM